MNKYSDIGFLVHLEDLYHHYSPVWSHMGEGSYQVVLENREVSQHDIDKQSLLKKINHVYVSDVLKDGYKYPYLISNHALLGHNGKTLIEAIGDVQIRFMYALGKGKHNFGVWNKLYDIIMCFGPYQEKCLEFCTNTVKIQMGYPRYDAYFNNTTNRSIYRDKFNLNQDKKTIVWLPTWNELSSIDLYADHISTLSKNYNIVVKPHPLTTELEKERINLLNSLPFTSVITSLTDMLHLFYIADFVLCDYGGPAFGSIYLDKKLILLNTAHPQNNELTGDNSPDIRLRENIVNIDFDTASKLADILENEQIWQEQSNSRNILKKIYFAPYYGFSSIVAANIIINAKNILAASQRAE